MDLERAFGELFEGFVTVRQRVTSEEMLRVLREMLEMSFEAYREGNEIRGAHILQEFEGLIWPSRKVSLGHESEARRRLTTRDKGSHEKARDR